MNIQPYRSISLTGILILICVLVTGTRLSRAEEQGYVITDDGVRLFYRVVGEGNTPLVVVHGGPGNTMNSILPDFGRLTAKHRIIFYDQRGNGRSDLVDDPDDLAIEHHIEDLEAIRRHFNLEKMILLGNSWGGLLASYYAIRYPNRIEKLILHCAASPSYDHMRAFAPLIINRIPEDTRDEFRLISNPIKWLTSLQPRKICQRFYELLIPVYFSNPENAALMRGNVCSGPEDAVRRQQSVNNTIWQSLGEWNILPELSVVTSPTLVIHGEDDMIPTASSEDWTRSLPNARMLIIQNAGHMSHVEQPTVFFDAIETFLRGDWPAAAIDIKRGKKATVGTGRTEIRKEPEQREKISLPTLPLY